MGTNVPITPVLKLPNRIIFEREGENDGLVSVKSASWTGFQGTIDADHARQIGVNAMNGRFDAPSFVASLAESAASARHQAG
jgi:triacylglycerol lipase